MGKTIFVFVIFLLITNNIFSKNISFNVYDFETFQPISKVEILIFTNNMKKFLSLKTDNNGIVQIDDITDFCNEDTIFFRISGKNYYTFFTYRICKEKVLEDIDFVLLPKNPHPYGYGFEDFKFKDGTVELDSFSNVRVKRLFPVCDKEMQFQVLMNMFYNKKENNSFDLAFKRANKVIHHLIDNGWNGDEFLLKVRQSDYAHLNFEVIGNYMPNR